RGDWRRCETMTNYDPRDPRYRGPDQNPPTRAYSQAHDYGDYRDPQYQDPAYYQDPSQYQDPAQYGYAEQPHAPKRTRRRGPDIDPLMFCGGVLMTGVVTGLAAWLVAWVIRVITQKINDIG